MAAETKRYTSVAITLHWLIAVAILSLIPVGLWMSDANRQLAAGTGDVAAADLFAIFQLHKTIGLAVLFLSIARIAWRILNPPPPLPDSLTWWERAASNTVHFGFYFLMLAIPLSGWVMVSASPLEIETFLFQISALQWPHIPGLADLSYETKVAIEPVLLEAHEILALSTLGLLFLHVGAVVKHQVIDRDGVLARMAPGLAGKTSGVSHPARGGVIASGLALAVLAGGLAWGALDRGEDGPVLAEADQEAPTADAGGEAASRSLVPVTGAPDWTVDPVASALTFEVMWEGEAVQGVIAAWTADIRFDPEDLDASRATVLVDGDSLETGVAYLDSQIPRADGFHVTAHPQARFQTTGFRSVGGDAFEADGELTVRDVTIPVTLPFSLAINGDRARMEGEVTIDRRDLALGMRNDEPGAYLGFDVTVRALVEATRAE